MVFRKRALWFPTDGSEEWLSVEDSELAIHMLRLITGSAAVAEVGVWKGGWATAILQNTSRSTIFLGIDPFPNASDVKQILLERIGSLGLGERFSLVDSFDQVPKKPLFDLIHVDGMHTEDQVAIDLLASAARLKDDGVLVVDDYSSPWFPGVQAAMYGFLQDQDFRIFLVSPNKAYLARSNVASSKWHLLRDTRGELAHSRLWENWAESFPLHRYVQKTDVLGQPVLVCQRL
jgi:hypothetical protein